jgi:hypothetical protein
MSSTTLSAQAATTSVAAIKPAAERLATANRIFAFALSINLILTVFCLVAYATGKGTAIAGAFQVSVASIVNVLIGITLFHIIWGFVWYGVKNLLLARFVGMSKDDRRAAFSSRMAQPYEIPVLLERYSERRIRITDMIGRRGRFITLALAAFFYLYVHIDAERPGNFATAFLNANLMDGVLGTWLYIALFRNNSVIGAALFGPQSRVMDGMLARANCLLILTLWGLFKFVLVPIGTQLAALYSPEQFALIFAFIWGSYIVTDTLAEVGGSLYGRQRIRVVGVGDINRKSIGGTVTGFIGALVFCVALVATHHLPASWYGLAICIALSNTTLELVSPRGTDDFTMATGNTLICWAFGLWLAA